MKCGQDGLSKRAVAILKHEHPESRVLLCQGVRSQFAIPAEYQSMVDTQTYKQEQELQVF